MGLFKNMLSKLQLQRVCLLHQGHKQCRYLAQDDDDPNKHYCLKQTSEKKIIDSEVLRFLKEKKDAGEDPTQEGTPLGNGGGCSGYIVLKTKLQGYDVK